jgi:uncharacterized 2Fe-2S/4Fe-4S cluster protein (DUF4445 family)
VDSSGQSRRLRVEPEQAMLAASELLHAHGVLLNTRCGQQGTCDGCEVELVRGSAIDLDTNRAVTAGKAPLRMRACRSRLVPSDDLAIRVPRRSLAAHEPLATADFSLRVPYGHAPMFAGRLAAAVDAGTTSVTVAIVNLENGAILAAHSALNAQSRCGADVLSRISHCQRNRQAVAELQHAICRETIRPLVDRCLESLNGDAAELAGMTISGNTVMLHLLAGEDPTPLGQAPFRPVFVNHRILTAGEMGLVGPGLADLQPVHLLPSASAYLGADIVAGAVVTGLAYRHRPSILLDLGTNGEIVLKHGQRTLACATAAGPAFEGAGLTCGMTASRGAISRVRMATDPPGITLEVVGDQPPRGICGSAYVDLLAEGRRLGLVDRHGRLKYADAPALAQFDHQVGGETALRLAADPDGQPIVLTEGDIAALLQAKAAIAAGALTLLEQCGLAATDVCEALVAGAFGAHLDPDNAVNIGLLPEGFRGRSEAVGNTSLAGAYLLAVDRRYLDDLNRFAQEIEVVELNHDPSFESRYIDQLLLP